MFTRLLAAAILIPGLALAQEDLGTRIQISQLEGEVEIRPGRPGAQIPWINDGSEINVRKGRVVLNTENHVRIEGEPGDRFQVFQHQGDDERGVRVEALDGAVVVAMGDTRVLLPPNTSVVAYGAEGEGRIDIVEGPIGIAPGSVLHEGESLEIDTQLGALASGDVVHLSVPEEPLTLAEAALFGDIAVTERGGLLIARSEMPADIRLAPAPLPPSTPTAADMVPDSLPVTPLRWPGTDGMPLDRRFVTEPIPGW